MAKAQGAKLASAFVEIVPSAKNVGKSIVSAFQSAGDKAGSKAGSVAGESYKQGFASQASGVGLAAKAAVIAGVTATGAALATLGKQALDAYATYEQAIGGVQTLFKDAANDVAANAAQAFKSAGMSTNDYMNTVTSFAAAMTASVGGNVKKSAQLSDMAIRDMSDNANKMGTSMDSIVQTYQSLSRGNYAMLDNLKLGYGGTKTELQRLLKDASKLPAAMGKKFDISNFGDVVTAIHLVQENLGITGTTAKEAATTIEGSVNSMKAAWSNWVTGLGRNDANLAGLSSQLVESVITVGKNIAPRIVQIFKGVVSALPQVVTGFSGEFQKAFTDIFSNLGVGSLFAPLSEQFDYAVQDILGKVSGLKTSLSNAWKNIQKVFTDTGSMNTLTSSLQTVMQSVLGIVHQLVTTTLDYWNSIVQGFSNTSFLTSLSSLVQGAMKGISAAVQGVSAFLQPVIRSFGELTTAVVKAIIGSKPFQDFLTKTGTLLQKVGEFLRAALAPLGQWVSMIVSFVTQSGVLSTVMDVLAGALSGIVSMLTGIVDAVTSVWTTISPIITQALALIMQVLSTIAGEVANVWNSIMPIIQPVLDLISTSLSTFGAGVAGVWSAAWSGIQNVLTNVWNVIQTVIQGALNSIQGIVSVFTAVLSGNWSQAWNNLVSLVSGIFASLGNVVKAGINLIGSILGTIHSVVMAAFSGAGNWLVNVGSQIIKGLGNGIKNSINWVKDIISNLGHNIVDWAKSALGIHSPSRIMRDEVGKYISLGIADGITKNMGAVQNGLDDVTSLRPNVKLMTAYDTGTPSAMRWEYERKDTGSLEQLDKLTHAVEQFHDDMGDIIADNTPIDSVRKRKRIYDLA